LPEAPRDTKGDVEAPKPDVSAPPPPVPSQAGLPSQGEVAVATPPSSEPAVADEITAAPVNTVPGEPVAPTVVDPVEARAPENVAASDMTTAPAPQPEALPEPGIAAAPSLDASPPAPLPPVAGDTPAAEPPSSPSEDIIGQNGGTPPPAVPDQIPSVERSSGQPDREQIGAPGNQPIFPARDDPADPGVTGIDPVQQSSPPGDEPLAHETLGELQELVDDEARALDTDEQSAVEMSTGFVAGEDQVVDSSGLSELQPMHGDETLDNTAVESLVVTGVLLTPLGSSDDPPEPTFAPDDEALQEIEELVEEEAVEAEADEFAVEALPDEVLSQHDEPSAGDFSGGTPAGEDDEGRGYGEVSGSDVSGYREDEDDRRGDMADDDDRASHSADDDDE
jgi:hypothetical protein